ncbi:alternate-type signal peptide domain-containing protein [Arthrobacter sp. LAPM80]|uniref:alternate-type signal peptide domain-containing protein n=1 Tax=Arthrobacter sp. LAPM80 TaxID=3141788 RepID=UPI00398BA1E6
MNKMAKGAIATGVGIILLAGGGGTLATWNQASNASMGSVVSGDLNLVAGAGVWKNASGTVIPVIADYKVVPGDTLTYTQPMTVTLTGDLMVAKLAVTGAGVDKGFGTNAVATATTLTNAGNNKVVAADDLKPANSGQVVASTTFTFNQSTSGRTATNSSYDFSGIGYSLVQQAPVNSNGK